MTSVHGVTRKKGMTAKTCTRLIVLGLSLLLLYGGIAFLSQDFIYGQGHRQRPILLYVALYASAFTLYVFALLQVIGNVSFAQEGRAKRWKIATHGNQHILPLSPLQKGETRIFIQPSVIILGFALLFRVVFLFSSPIQEDDFYRYLWDGKVIASGLNPYGVAPSSVEEEQAGTQPYRAILKQDEAFGIILARVNHPWVPTIYPPLAQGIFGLAAFVAPGSLWGLRILFLLFDLSICFLLINILHRLQLNEALVLVYAWSPLVIKETINSTHYDVIPTFFLMLAVCALLHQWKKAAFVSLALAILGKLYPLLLAPFFLWRVKESVGWSRACEGIAILSVVIFAGYAPFLGVGAGLWQGAVTFVEQWQTNSFLFPLLATLVKNRWMANGVMGLVLGGLLFLLSRRHDLTDDPSFLWGNFVVLGALFLFSPVGDPWYFVWLTPFLCFFPMRSWILLSGLLGLYYLSFYFMYHDMKETFRWVVVVEYLPFYGMLIYEWYSTRSTREFSPFAK